ncbi:MAG: sugar phosphate isomerase/epimerase [Thaumarchaeota archaeon]|nr:sugar phosphate isomerase/epimerase [Nitrososphaerota archaeon]
MKLGLIENAWFDSPVGRVEGIGIAKELGFDTYDLFLDGITPPLRREMRTALRGSDLPVPTFIVLGYSLTDFNSDVRRYTLKWLKRQMDVGQYFESPTMVLVLGEHILEKVELKPEVEWKWALEGVRDLADYAKSNGMGVALEFPAHKFSIVHDVATMSAFLRDVKHDSVNTNVDVSHLYLMGDPPASISKLKGRVAHVHFSDCNGRVHGDLPPGRGVVPLIDYLAALKKIGYAGSVSLELEWSPEPGKIREWVGEAYDATEAMMARLGVRPGR